jgi:hypothetical protein
MPSSPVVASPPSVPPLSPKRNLFRNDREDVGLPVVMRAVSCDQTNRSITYMIMGATEYMLRRAPDSGPRSLTHCKVAGFCGLDIEVSFPVQD